MAKRIISLGVLGLTAADVKFDYCIKISDDSEVHAAGTTLAAAGVTLTPYGTKGDYAIGKAVTADTAFGVYVTASPEFFDADIWSPVDGDEARESNLAIVASYIDTEITTTLDRLGTFTGTGVNTVLGFFKSLLKKDAAVPSDIGGSFDPATDSTEALAEKLATGVTVNPVQVSTGVIQKKVTVTNGETIEVTRGDYLEAGDITFNFGPDWDCTGKEVWFCVKATYTGTKLIDVKFTLTDAANAIGENAAIDLQTIVGLTAGEYLYEFERVLPGGTRPRTPKRGKLMVYQDVRN